jgi:hypothetical protein
LNQYIRVALILTTWRAYIRKTPAHWFVVHVAYNAPLVTRRERAEKLRQKKANFFNAFTPAARRFGYLLEKYAGYGIGEFDQLPAFAGFAV